MSAQARFILSILLVPVTIAIGTLGYMIVEQQSVGDSAYMTVITVFTVGFREVFPVSMAGRLWTVAVIVLGYGAVSVALATFVSLMVSGELRSITGRARMKQQIEKLRGHIIICGYGRMGSLVAHELQRGGVAFVVIDSGADKQLSQEGYLFISGDATEDQVLIEAGIMHANALVTCLTSDADNVYVTLSAREFRRDLNIISRSDQPSTEKKLIRAGATSVVNPQTIGASKAAALLLRPHVVDFVDMAARGVDMEIAQFEISPSSPFVGIRLRESGISQNAQVTVVAIKRGNGEQIFDPDPDELIHEADQLILVGRGGLSERLDGL